MISCIETAPGVFELSGRVDVTSVADLRTALSAAVDSSAALAAVPGAAVRFHVRGLELIDAAGLGALVAARRRAGRAGLGFVLLDVPDPLSRLLFISRLYRVISVERPGIGPVREIALDARWSASKAGIPASSSAHADADPYVSA